MSDDREQVGNNLSHTYDSDEESESDSIDHRNPNYLSIHYAEKRHILGGDELRNINSYEYLKKIAEKIFKNKDYSDKNKSKSYELLETFVRLHSPVKYNPNIAYGDDYTLFINALESDCENKALMGSELVDDIVHATYFNENKALERAAAMTNDIITTENQVEKKITRDLNKDQQKVNKLTPQNADAARFKLAQMIVSMGINATKETSKAGRFFRKLAKAGKYDFKPMSTTSMVSVRKYNMSSGPTELRSGTQAQYHECRPRVNPIFKRLLKTLENKEDPEKITYVYINNLGRDRFEESDKLKKEKNRHERIFESKLTAELENLEGCDYQLICTPINDTQKRQVADGSKVIFERNDQGKWAIYFRDKDGHLCRKEIRNLPSTRSVEYLEKLIPERFENPVFIYDKDIKKRLEEMRLSFHEHAELPEKHGNVAVITLPADHGLLNKKFVSQLKPKTDWTVTAAFDVMFQIAKGSSKEPIQDFYISDKVEKLLYGVNLNGSLNTKAKEEKLNALLTNSFRKILCEDNPQESPGQLSEAEQQAVYFHFIKYELTNFIIDTLKPPVFNISCKDGIDRGGVASAYYNLMKSFESSDKCLTEDEFNRALHASATNIKGRGVNNNLLLIWNAVNGYIEGFNKSKSNEKEAAPNIVNENKIPEWLVVWRNKNAPKNTKQYFINKLDEYSEERKRGNRHHFFFESQATEKNIKLSAASSLKKFLETGEKPTFSLNQWNALHDGELKKIRKKIEKAGFSLKDFKPQISNPSPPLPLS